MTIHALERLAKEAMGRTLEDCFEHLDADTFGAAHGDVWFGDSAGNVEVWRPHEDTTQAVKLLEAWCERARGRYVHHRHLDSTHFVELKSLGGYRPDGSGLGSTFVAATTRAVCEAMGIDPEATE